MFHRTYSTEFAVRSTPSDAINLAIASNVDSENTSTVIIHMTRTASLHRLRSGALLEFDFTMTKQVGDEEIPILCHPQLPYLLAALLPGVNRPDNLYGIGENFYRFA